LKITICHVITDLITAGAQMVLFRLLGTCDRQQFEPVVISLTDKGTVGPKIEELGIPVWALGMRSSAPNPLKLLKLVSLLREIKPDLVQTWMYHGDLLGGMAAWRAGKSPVIWGIHNTALSLGQSKVHTILTRKVCALLSGSVPRKIVAVSQASAEVHKKMGYCGEKMVLIPNGTDLDLFQPSLDAREQVRQELGLPLDIPLIGLVARWDPQKDHRNFLQAAARILSVRQDVRFVLCGNDINWENKALAEMIGPLGIQPHCHLLGRREDMHRIYPALDILVSSSLSEAFPTVVCEAMACGVPCVVTDVGDSALIVGDTGRVVPPSDPESLAKACLETLELNPYVRSQLGQSARQRIQNHFSLRIMVERYEALYRQVVAR